MVLEKVSITQAEIESFAREQGLPKQGLADYFTRLDELMIAQLKLMKSLEISLNLSIPAVKKLPLQEMKTLLESGQYMPYDILRNGIDMTTARTDEEFVVEGDHLTAQTDGTLDGVTIRFNIQSAPAVPIKYFNPWSQQFFRIYLTHTAQAGKTLYLAIGREASAETSSFSIAAELMNKVSAVVDSTTTALAGNASYTGAAFSVEEYGKIIGVCYSDVAGTLYIDQRSDGSNWDSRETLPYTAGEAMGFIVEVMGNEGRLVYTNGAGAQTTFRLYARLRRI
jgi:hypothetical protein